MRLAKIYIGIGCLIVGLGIALVLSFWPPAAEKFTQEDINAAVMHALNTQNLPSRSAKAAELIRPSVVRVQG